MTTLALPADEHVEAVTSLFLSPHFDDVVFSCGGLVAQLTSRGDQVLVATCCTEGPQPGEPSSEALRNIHRTLWKIEDDEAVVKYWAGRREEDAAAVARVGARHFWLGYPDALYRGGQYYSGDSILGRVQPRDAELVERLCAHVVALWRRTRRAVVYLPLAIGNHVDHQLAFMVNGALREAGAELWHYEDFPYVARGPYALALRLAGLGAPYRSRTIDITDHIETRIAAMGLYASQLEPTFGRVGGPYPEFTRSYAATVGSAGGYAERLWSLSTGGSDG